MLALGLFEADTYRYKSDWSRRAEGKLGTKIKQELGKYMRSSLKEIKDELSDRD
ncbi:MAG: hypothetical protein MK066_00150 [Crocinitomicaceae bacterium]|nr:hypothetical protein [Crocinitomicaceae bacterium]